MRVDELIPHQGVMRLVDELVQHDEATAEVVARLTPDNAFADGEGRVPAWVGVELMAQSVAAWAGARAAERGEQQARGGYLLGCRSYDCERDRFPRDAELRIHVREVLRQDNGFGSYTGEIHVDGERMARGKLSVLEANEQESGGEPSPETGGNA